MERNGNQSGMARRNSNEGLFPSFNSFFPDFFDLDRFFPSAMSSPMMQQIRQQPAVNIIENDKEFRVEVSAPGMRKEDFHIDIEENMLTISAERKFSNEESNGNGQKAGKDDAKKQGSTKDNGKGSDTGQMNERYTRREFGYSQFSRSFMLPDSVEPEKIQANYQDGILKLSLPKRAETSQKQRRKIDIS